MKKRCPHCGKKLKKKEYESHILDKHSSTETLGEKGDFRCYDDCIRCCEDPGAPLELTLGDIIRIKEHLSVTPTELFEEYCFLMWNMIPETQTLIPSIGLRFPCGFLKGGKCTIYDMRPIHCRLFPEGLFVDSTPRNLEPFTGTGYKCIDRGFKVGDRTKKEMLQLKAHDKDETKATAEYFENLRYSYRLKKMEFNMISGLLKDVDEMDKNERRREICTDMINNDLKKRAEEDFTNKIRDLKNRKVLEKQVVSVRF